MISNELKDVNEHDRLNIHFINTENEATAFIRHDDYQKPMHMMLKNY